MRQRIYRPGTAPRRRYFYAVAALALATTSVLAMGPSQAVHDEGFALQGNLCGTGIDWEDLFDVTGSPTVTTPKASLPGAFTAAAFAKDWVLPDTTGYATGSKDELPISLPGGGDWQCKTPNNLGAKFDLVNAYAAALVPTTGDDAGDLIVYFGSEVSAPEGNRNMGVWLLQDPTVGCSGVGNTDFSGSHVDGDVFVVAAFTGGGGTANIDVYEWVDSTPADDDADVGGSLVLKQGFTNVTCPASGAGDDACAIANTDGDKDANEAAFEVNPPWDAPDKDGGNLNEAQFMEGGVNLSDLGLSGCFPTFLANSRSSQIPGSDAARLRAFVLRAVRCHLRDRAVVDQHHPRRQHHRHRHGDGLGCEPAGTDRQRHVLRVRPERRTQQLRPGQRDTGGRGQGPGQRHPERPRVLDRVGCVHTRRAG